MGTTADAWLPSANFWQNTFDKSTNDGQEAALFKNIVPENILNSQCGIKAVRQLQIETARSASPSSRLRLYINNDRRDDLAGLLLEPPSNSGNDLPELVSRATGAEKFCLVVNNLELLVGDVNSVLGTFLQTMFECRGTPIGGCEAVLFAGNYAETSFGFHEGFEHAFLVHLGPGVKDFYCMPSNTYVETTGGREPTFGELDFLLDRSTKLQLDPGDILYLPAHVYHIGKQTSFSVSIALPLYSVPQERFFLKGVLPLLIDELLIKSEQPGSPYLLPNTGADTFLASQLPILESAVKNLQTKCHERGPDILRYYWYRLMSNGYWEVRQSSFEDLEKTNSLNEREDSFMPGDLIELKKPFKAFWSQLDCKNNELRIFLKGESTVSDNKPVIIQTLNNLNSYYAFPIPCDQSALDLLSALDATGALIRYNKSQASPLSN
jgi:hypothetical protein